MIDYQTITELVNQIPTDTWDVLREIKERRPAMMLSELIDYRSGALQRQEPAEQATTVIANDPDHLKGVLKQIGGS